MGRLIPLLSAVAGILIILCRDRLVRSHLAFQNQAFRRDYGARDQRIGRWVLVLVGGGFIVWGLVGVVIGYDFG